MSDLPNRRPTIRQRAVLSHSKVYLDVGLTETGQPGEIFLVVEKTGADRRFVYDEVARLASKLLQHGYPLEDLARGWVGTKDQFGGPVRGDERIKHCTGLLDYVGRYLLLYHSTGYDDLAHVPRRSA